MVGGIYASQPIKKLTKSSNLLQLCFPAIIPRKHFFGRDDDPNKNLCESTTAVSFFFTLWGHAVRNKHCTFVPAAGTGLTTWRGAGLHGILLHTLHKFIRFRTYSENLLGWRAEGVNWRYKNARLSGYIGLEKYQKYWPLYIGDHFKIVQTSSSPTN